MSEKKSKKLQIKDAIEKAGKITATRNTKAGGKLVTKGKPYNVPMDISLEDALELVLINKAVIGGKPEDKKK